ncbi:MAG: LacI family DNA-binding transcriptional regulator [Caldilineaceae bacterium]
MITVKHVAQAAGVSPGTVSNTLTGKRPVSAKTRARIFQAIEELGYKPNLLARSLVNRRSHFIAVITSEIDQFGPSRILSGIEAQAEELGYSLLLSLMRDPSQADVESTITNLVARGVDGIIWAVHQVGNNRRWFTRERRKKLPPIVFVTMEPKPGFTIINSNNRAGAALAVNHLIDTGCRVIGHISGPLDWWEARERLTGWRQSLAQAGLENTDDLVARGSWSAESGEAALHQLLSQRSDIDSIFLGNDQMAIGALQAAHRRGYTIPHDLALVGFDNIPESRYLWPPLTTIHQGLFEIGKVALQTAHDAIEYPDEFIARQITHQPELIVRESTGVVHSSGQA